MIMSKRLLIILLFVPVLTLRAGDDKAWHLGVEGGVDVENDLAERKFVIGAVAVLIVAVYIVRLFTLQITSDDYKKSADSNAFLKKVDFPSRGNISDRNGKLLVFNQPAYDIMVVMNEAKDHHTALRTRGLGSSCRRCCAARPG